MSVNWSCEKPAHTPVSVTDVTPTCHRSPPPSPQHTQPRQYHQCGLYVFKTHPHPSYTMLLMSVCYNTTHPHTKKRLTCDSYLLETHRHPFLLTPNLHTLRRQCYDCVLHLLPTHLSLSPSLPPSLSLSLPPLPQWGNANAKIKKVLPLKPVVGQSRAMHATLTARDFFHAIFYNPGSITRIFPNIS